jgi:hypothetical protein
MTMDSRVEGQPAAPAPKKPYHSPQLQVYGNIRTLTQSSAAGISDGMSGTGMTSTSA